LDELHAAILRVKLKSLDSQNGKRAAIAGKYSDTLSKLAGIDVPYVNHNVQHIFHQYVVRVKHRDLIKQRMLEHNIQTAIHYPTPIHKQTAYFRDFKQHVSLDTTNRAATEILSLPIYPDMTLESIHYNVEVMTNSLESING
jgi:dTDP-4-amino-4,6-dideoxygalactose transaminase